jgi:hypothetical protein
LVGKDNKRGGGGKPGNKIMSKYKIGVLFIIFLTVFILASGCGRGTEFDRQVGEIAKPYNFQLVKWEFQTLTGEIGGFFSGEGKTDNETAEIITYFTNAARIRNLEATLNAVRAGNQAGELDQIQNELDELRSQNTARRVATEKALERQVREALAQQDIYNPLDRYVKIKISFPPVRVYLGEPPNILVISPRDRIEAIKEVILVPDMSVEDMEKIESEIEQLGYSAEVEGLGGLSTYPSYVLDESDLRFTLETVVHEWIHQYLAFTPLGFRYILGQIGIPQNSDIATINETVADIVGREIGDMIYHKLVPQAATPSPPPPTDETGFDFNKEMREIRLAVDNYLAQGQIEQAEAFMEQSRQYLAENGYYIRKLNQAYFAFHGTYADSPTSTNPIGEELQQLREQSVSIRDFLDAAVGLTSEEQLINKLD